MKTQARNELCKCGSNKKYKVCCGKKEHNFADVFTPTPLVQEMLEHLGKDAWDRKKTFIDPACGDGQFLVEVLKRKLEKNHPILEAISSIHGIEIQEKHAIKCRERLFEIATKDSEDYGMACKLGNQVCIGVSLTHAKEIIKEIIEWNIVCADALTFDTKTWGGKGQHSIAAMFLKE